MCFTEKNIGSKKSKILTTEHIKQFLNEVSDVIYILRKTAFVLGTTGACRMEKLKNLKMSDILDMGFAVLTNKPQKRKYSENVHGIW